MKIIQWNIRGYRAKYPELLSLMQSHNPSVVCLQEAMLGDRVPRAPNGYSLQSYSSTNAAVPGDGLVFLFRLDVPYLRIPLNTTLQAFAFRTGTNPQLVICNLYISPNAAFNANQLEALVNQLDSPFIVLGDFNAKSRIWGSETENSRGQLIEDYLERNEVCIMNNGLPTRFDTYSGNTSALDLTLCSPQLQARFDWTTEDETHGSDHFPIIISTENAPSHKRPTFIEKKADWTEFYERTRIADEPMENTSVSNCVALFTEHVTSAAYASIPIATRQTLPKCVPWWTPECTAAKAERRRTQRLFQRTRLQCDLISMKRARAISVKTLKQTKKASWESFVSTLNVDTPMTKIWSRVKKMSGKYSPHTSPCLLVDGEYMTDPAAVANKLADHYDHVSSGSTYSQRFQTRKSNIEAIPIDFSTNEELDYNVPLTLTELKGALKQSKKSAPGDDLITYEMLRRSHPSLIQYLLKIYNKIWESGEYPQAWRKATVLPFHKQGKLKTLVSSYRPVNLTSCPGKLLEKISNNRLVYYLEKNNIYSPVQYGFRKHRSTMDPTTILASNIQEAFQKGEQVICVFFDIDKAYDTTWKQGILIALKEAGIRGRMAFFIKGFLQRRLFRVRIGDTFSDEHEQQEGVPQGSVLSCTLFGLAINDLPAAITNGTQSSLYVDDFALYTSSRSLPALQRRLQIAINKAFEWADNHGFSFSSTKTTAVHFHKKQGVDQPQLTLKDGNSNRSNQISFQTSAKFLGVVFDQKLNWELHIKELKQECYKKLNLLKCVCHQTWGADKTVALRLYSAIVQPKLDYGCILYGSASDYSLQKLDPVLNRGVRDSSCAFRSSPINSLLAEAGIPPLSIRRQQIALQYYARSKKTPDTPTHECITKINSNVPSMYSTRVKDLINRYDLRLDSTLEVRHTEKPTWMLDSRVVCDGYDCPPKETTSEIMMKQIFRDHVDEHHSNADHIYTDGSKSDQLAYAAVHGTRIRARKMNPKGSIFTAELMAILQALWLISGSSQSTPSVIFSDSKSAIQAIQDYQNTHPIVTRIFDWLARLHARQKEVKICWVPSHVGISGNEAADQAAKQAAEEEDQVDHSYEDLPHSDHYNTIKQVCRDAWQTMWANIRPTENKLRAIKNTTQRWRSSTQSIRKHEVVLTRIRIGHTRLTHGYLMQGGNREPPICENCGENLSVKHVLAECPSYNVKRHRHFPATVPMIDTDAIFTEMVAETPQHHFKIDPLIRYLKDIKIYDQI